MQRPQDSVADFLSVLRGACGCRQIHGPIEDGFTKSAETPLSQLLGLVLGFSLCNFWLNFAACESGYRVGKKRVGVPVRVWKWGAFSAACTAIPLLGQVDWKTLAVDYQTIITGILAVVAALGTIVQMRASDHRNNKRRDGFELRAPTARPRRRHHEENQIRVDEEPRHPAETAYKSLHKMWRI